MAKITTKQIIERAKEAHGNKYDYSKVEYTKMHEKVCIICPEHGEFWQTPHNHIRYKQGCPKCNHRSYKLTTEEWIEKAKTVHGNKYDYSKVEYIDSKTKVCIICPEHGEFWQVPNNHLKTGGCPKCGKLKITSDTNSFIQKATLLHKDKYDYNKVKYKTNSTPVIITCPIHGDFEQTPNHHLSGQGCPICNSSKGEIYIENYLKLHNIKYIHQYAINIDKNINPSGKAYIDFYIPDLNIAIEYNGEQHYKSIKYFEKINHCIYNN